MPLGKERLPQQFNWSSSFCVLSAKQTLRYSEIRKETGNITDAVLASALKTLIENKMIKRKSYDEFLPEWNIHLRNRGNLLFRYYRAFAIGQAFFIMKIRMMHQRWFSAKSAIIGRWSMIESGKKRIRSQRKSGIPAISTPSSVCQGFTLPPTRMLFRKASPMFINENIIGFWITRIMVTSWVG